jgi:hypothetical protein
MNPMSRAEELCLASRHIKALRDIADGRIIVFLCCVEVLWRCGKLLFDVACFLAEVMQCLFQPPIISGQLRALRQSGQSIFK